MTICFLSTCQFDEFAGGLDRVCCQLSREFIRRGYKLVYVFGKASVLGHPADGCEGEGQYQFPFTIWDDRNIAFFSEVIAKHKVDVVIDAAFVSRYHDIAYQAKKQTPFKLITTYHGDPLCDIKEIKDKIDCLSLRYQGIELFTKRIYAYLKYPASYAIRYKSLRTRFTKIVSESDYYVVLCEDYAKKLRKITNDSHSAHIVSISNPIELTTSSKELPSKINQVLFVGRLNEQKRVDRLLRVWAKVEKKLTGWKLVVIGEGDSREQYEDFSRSLQLKNVQFLGNINSNEEMMRSRIVAMVSSHEGFGMTLVEGMAVGTVPMAFDSYDALRDIVDDGVNGCCIRPWDYEGFASKIVALANDENLWQRLSSNAKMAVKKFDIRTIVDRWDRLFAEHMTILQINFYDIFSTGNIMLNIARVSRERGHRAYTASKWVKTAVDRKRNDPYHYYIGTRLENTFHRYFSWMTDWQDCASVCATKRLIRKIEKINPDIIHLHDIVGWYLNIDILFKYLKQKNVPVVWTFHDCWAFTGRCIYFDAVGCDRWKTGCGNCPQLNYMPKTWWFDQSAWNYRRKKKLFTSLEKLTIVTPSVWLKGLTEQSFFAGRDIRVINNGIDLSRFNPQTNGDYYDRFKKLNKKIVLGVAGTWSVRKGLDALVRLSKDLPEDYHVVVVGTDGDYGDRISTIACTHNQSELAELYSVADVYVNPTIEENFPTVNLESLACGTPIVTYRTGGSPESVTEQTGVVVEKGDYEALKEAIISICEKGKETFSEACLEAAKKYDMNARFNDYVDLYEEILKNNQ